MGPADAGLTVSRINRARPAAADDSDKPAAVAVLTVTIEARLCECADSANDRVSKPARSITLPAMSKLAVPIWVNDVNSALREVARAAEQGADLVELRLDRFADQPEAAASLVQEAALPSIATCRPTWEGGHFEGDDTQRLML